MKVVKTFCFSALFGVWVTAGSVASIGAVGDAAARDEAAKTRPNILLLMTDQQTLRAMSAAGNPYLHTPNMDSLAAGVRFTISYCASPVCAPSRSSIITGRMPHETGVNFNGDVPDPSIPNLGEVFRAAGYETAWAGKWHLPASYPRPPKDTVPGFEYLSLPKDIHLGLGEQTDGIVADRAIAFLRRKHDRPWLLGVSLHNPHDICWWARLEPVRPRNPHLFPPLPDNFDIAPDEPGFLADCRKPKTYGVEQQYADAWDEMQWRAYLYEYYRLTEQVDRVIGRILHALRARKLDENTLIVFTSDHGEGVAGHRLIVKLTPYDGAATVPLILCWPGVIPAGREDAVHPVSGIDIVPTLCDYADVPLPQPTTGISLRRWIERPDAGGREAVVIELAPFKKQPHRQGRIVRTRRFKYMTFTDGERPEALFDMQADPGETKNLAGDARYRDQLDRHRRLLRDWLRRTNDAFRAAWMK
ncbi:MAG: sulfatase-like hydrolase/transferase [Planctomycetes bacterium]|nr:sulfatase-like hydrolase/transferase [Planctomycetota bacterium]